MTSFPDAAVAVPNEKSPANSRPIIVVNRVMTSLPVYIASSSGIRKYPEDLGEA